jgi:GAF domain-containing protein
VRRRKLPRASVGWLERAYIEDVATMPLGSSRVEDGRLVLLLDDLGRFATDLAQQPDAGAVLSTLAASLREVLHLAGVGVLVLADDAARSLVAGSPGDVAKLERLQARSRTGPGIAAALSGKDVDVSDFSVAESSWSELVEAAAGRGFCSLAAVPMFWEQRSFGSIELYADQPRD